MDAKNHTIFECFPDQLRTPKQKGLEIIGDLSGFDPCNRTVEFKIPESNSRPGLIISVHGGAGKMDAIRITNEFFELGYATLIFDVYSMNNLPLRGMANAYRQMMLLKTSYAAYKWALNREEIDNSKIYFYGISNGASAVINIAGLVSSDHVKGVIVEAPTPVGIGYPDEINVPINIIFGKLDDLAAPIGKKRWEISSPCSWNRNFDMAPSGFSKHCRKGKSKNKSTPTTLDWIKKVKRKNNSQIKLNFFNEMAHAAFYKDLKIGTRNLGYGELGWSLGATKDARQEMIKNIKEFFVYTELHHKFPYKTVKKTFLNLDIKKRKFLQTNLKEYGYTNVIDGLWGKGTSLAIFNYILKNGIYVNKTDENINKQFTKIFEKIMSISN